MISFGNAASSYSGLIPLKTANKKRGELLWAIVSRKNFINLHSVAFVTVLTRNLIHAYKFRIFQKTAPKCFYKFDNPRSITNKYTLQVSRTLKTERLLNRASNITNFPPRFSVYKWASSLFTGIVPSFICTCIWKFKFLYFRNETG